MSKLIDYSTKDYEGFREDMLELIPQIMPEWTDRSHNDPGVVLLELLAHQLESLSYYNDRVANETFLSTATQRQSVINHCKLIGYDLRWATPARHYQVFEIEPQEEETIIPAGFQVGTEESDVEEPLIFETSEDLIIPAGETGLEQDEEGNYLYQVEVEHGQTIEEDFVGTVTSADSVEDYMLNFYPVIKESIQIEVEEPNGRNEWQMVDDYVSSDQLSMHYDVSSDEFGRVFVGFGNGVSGRIPSPPSSVYASYKVGGGEIGNVGAETINEFYDSVPGLVSTTNPFGPHARGRDMESIEEAKINAPASLRQLDRYVTLSDYEEGLKLDFPELVSKIKAVNNNGTVELYILDADGEAFTDEQYAVLGDYLYAKTVIFVEVQKKEPVFIPIDIDIEVQIYSNYDELEIQYSVQNAIMERLSPQNVDFGQSVTLANIHHTIMGIEGVRNVHIETPSEDIIIGETEVPRLNNITVTART